MDNLAKEDARYLALMDSAIKKEYNSLPAEQFALYMNYFDVDKGNVVPYLHDITRSDSSMLTLC